MNTGGVLCWGGNSSGQLGDGTTTNHYTPAAVSGLSSGVTAIAAGYFHTCALMNTGGVLCWGGNSDGQLGDGTTTNHYTPVAVSGLSSGVTAIAAGSYHTCALTNTGGVLCWGNNWYGQLGDGTTTNRYAPVAVNGLSSGVVAIAAGGFFHTCALTNTGGVLCWGNNWYGQLGDGTTTNRYAPAAVSGLSSGVTAIAADGDHTCALTNTGGVLCWGNNWYGQLGDGTTTWPYSPVAVSGLSSGITAIVVGGDHTCALTNTRGVLCWGNNYYGQLGDGTTTNRYTPVAVSGLSSGVAAIAAGGDHTCALMNTGGVLCWGDNYYGQRGDGTTTNRYTPVAVSGLSSGVVTIATGSDHTCALTNTGGVLCWGNNYYGQLGDGTTTNRYTPVAVSGLSGGVVTIATGSDHTCALMNTGGVLCWGENNDGRLGDGTTTTRYTPAAVSGLSSGVTAIAAGSDHTCALTNTGGVLCWGDNYYGQLGINPGWAPVDVVGLGDGPRVQVVNEQGVPVSGVRVYRNGVLVGNTSDVGVLLIPDMNIGDTLAATQIITEVLTQKNAHALDSSQNWAYRAYRTSVGINNSGNPNLYIVSSIGTQVLTIRQANVLVGFNIVVSVEWDANISYLEQLRQGFLHASDYLYDATDGQMIFERVTLYDNAQHWTDADYRIEANNKVRPNSPVGQILTSDSSRSEFGRGWDRLQGVSSYDQPDGFRTFVHEFGHYGLGLWDSYTRLDSRGIRIEGADCTSPIIETNNTSDINATLMDYQFSADKLAMKGVNGLWSTQCEQTEQYQRLHESDWETVFNTYSGTSVLGSWHLRTPADRGSVMPGPHQVPISGWVTSMVGNDANTGTCSVDPVYSFQLLGPIPAPNADVSLVKLDGTQIYQGKTNLLGRITVLGAANGDRLSAELNTSRHWTKSVTVSCTMQQRVAATGNGEIGVMLEQAPFNIDTSVIQGNVITQAQLRLKTSTLLSGTPQVRVSQSGSITPALVLVGYDNHTNTYTGTFSLDPALPQSGSLEVIAFDTASHYFSHVSEFALAIINPAEDTTIYSADGQAELQLPPGTLSGTVSLSIEPDRSVSATVDKLVMISGPYRIQAGPPVTLNGAAGLTLRYVGVGDSSFHIDLSSVNIYQWDESVAQWITVTSHIFQGHNQVAGGIDTLGIYAAMGVQRYPVYLPSVVR